MKFQSSYKKNRGGEPEGFAFVFAGQNILLNSKLTPRVSDLPVLLSEYGMESSDAGIFFGVVDGTPCYAFDMPADFGPESYNSETDGRTSFNFVNLRLSVGQLDPGINAAAGYAAHLMNWHKTSKFCGRCGSGNSWHEDECAKVCHSCGNVQFPKISPAIIIMIRKGHDILLAHNSHFAEGRYSLLAGFMEIGESVEETAAREVREEVGLEIENLKYVSSQGWPFPDSLMLGLTADYKSGHITPDGMEITDAGWYNPYNFPDIPGPGTIARKIIDEYKKTYKS